MQSNMKIFNPQHDLCLASGDMNFIPPAAILAFAQKCRWVERFMKELPGEAVTPWGWDVVLRESLIKEGWSREQLPTDEQLNFILEHSRRELAVELHECVCKELEGKNLSKKLLPPDNRIVASGFSQIEQAVALWRAVVLKSPLSGSGKGVRFVTGALLESDAGWCRRVLQKQGSVIVERREQVLQEFAMLFECAEEVKFAGYSFFYSKNGSYSGNILASNQYIVDEISKFVGEEVLDGVKSLVSEFLERKLHGRYKGFVGVDQFVCGGGFHPAVEINLRMTMGHVARNIFDNYRDEYSLGEATHKFEPEKGIWRF